MSIKTNELRLGNYVFDNENISMQIAKIETEKYTDWNSGNTFNAILEKDGQYYESDVMNYIPLTEKWLLEFGFNKDYKKGYIGKDFSNQDFVLAEPFVMGEWQKGYAFEFTAGGWSKYKEFNYVHELQNFYFAMTGEDLLTVGCRS